MTTYIRKLRAGRVANARASSWIGERGTIFYDEATGQLKISNGVTPGGSFIPLVIATSTVAGAIKAGPGANVSVDGTLTIDTTGLPLSFGHFTANDNALTVTSANEDMILVTTGAAEIKLIGNVGFYQTDGASPSGNFFRANKDGQISIYVPTSDPTAGAVKVIGSLSGQAYPPVNTGVMLHVTGNNNDASRIYNDGLGSFAAFVGRRINGTVVSPTAVQAGDEIIRISSTGHNGTTVPGTGSARIVYQAIENYTPTAVGSNISLWTTPIGSNVLTKVVTIDNANGMTATKANVQGNLSVNGTINIGAGTTTQAPVVYSAGNNLTTAAAGAIEYDGRAFYATPIGTQRGLIRAAQTYVLNADYNLTDQSTVQSMFGVAAAVSSNTRYAYTINAIVYKTSNNITMAYAVDGTAVLARHTYQTITTAASALATLNNPSHLKNTLTTGFTTPVTVTPALNGTGYYTITVTGIINVTTGGTWNPLVAFSGTPGAGSYVAVASSIDLYPIGLGNATVSIGNWT